MNNANKNKLKSRQPYYSSNQYQGYMQQQRNVSNDNRPYHYQHQYRGSPPDRSSTHPSPSNSSPAVASHHISSSVWAECSTHAQSRKRNARHLEDTSTQVKQARANDPSQTSWHCEINEAIEGLYSEKRQSADQFNLKLTLVNMLYQTISVHPVYKDCGLFITGSSLNGFGENSSDLDLCLVVDFDKKITRADAIRHLTNVRNLLQGRKWQGGQLRGMRIIKAVCPILDFRHEPTHLECDINVNNKIGIKNTFLLRHYSNCDPRVPSLVLYLKNWCRFQNINSAVDGTLSSYTLTLLVLNYLQCGIPSPHPPLVPILQKTQPELFPDKIKDMQGNSKPSVSSSENTMSLADLLICFFAYYTDRFCFDTDVVSVRQGTVIPICEMRILFQSNPHNCDGMGEKPNQWTIAKLFVEEPFNYSNAARCVTTYGIEMVKRKFRRAHHLLSKKEPLTALWNPL